MSIKIKLVKTEEYIKIDSKTDDYIIQNIKIEDSQNNG